MGNNKSKPTGVWASAGNILARIRRVVVEEEKEEDKIWNSNEYRDYTNCYAYAFDMLVHPDTGDKFRIKRGLEPGELSGKFSLTDNIMPVEQKAAYFAETTAGCELLVELVGNDMKKVGYEFRRCEEGERKSGEWKVALFVYPRHDWHWYREDLDGEWSHKQAQQRITRKVGTGPFGKDGSDRKPIYRQLGNDTPLNEIDATTGKPKTQLQIDAEKIGYPVFVDFFYVKKPSGK